jgi:hypothetical protein
MRHHSLWRAEPDGVLAAEADGLRLVVRRPDKAGGAVRFLVLRNDSGGQAITGSGTEESIQDAMNAAVRMAERLLARPFGAAPDQYPVQPHHGRRSGHGVSAQRA